MTEGACTNHPDRPAVERLGSRRYCAACRDSRLQVTRLLVMRAQPSECFASYAGAERWLPLTRGAPAHWLAHQLGAGARPGRPACAAGYALERAELLAGRKAVQGEAPRAGDLWVDLDAEGCGLVVSCQRHETRGFSIAVRYLEPLSARESLVDFYLQLAARGRFFR